MRRPIGGVSASSLERFAARTARALRLGRIDVLLTGNAEMRALNRRFRGKDQPTDVLSFPAKHNGSAPRSPNTGDIAISAQIAAANARSLGHSLGDEVKILLLHGALHLAGYDHETDNGEMARREAQLRTRLRLPGSLISRTVNATGRANQPKRRAARRHA